MMLDPDRLLDRRRLKRGITIWRALAIIAVVALIVVAVSAGSIIASHVNDGGFWIVAKYFNMTVKQTLMTWTVLETILSVVGFAAAALVWAVV